MVIALIGNITTETDNGCALIICNVVMEIGHGFVWKNCWIFMLLESSWRLHDLIFLNVLAQMENEDRLFVSM